jgi:hypothetical protein
MNKRWILHTLATPRLLPAVPKSILQDICGLSVTSVMRHMSTDKIAACVDGRTKSCEYAELYRAAIHTQFVPWRASRCCGFFALLPITTSRSLTNMRQAGRCAFRLLSCRWELRGMCLSRRRQAGERPRCVNPAGITALTWGWALRPLPSRASESSLLMPASSLPLF